MADSWSVVPRERSPLEDIVSGVAWFSCEGAAEPSCGIHAQGVYQAFRLSGAILSQEQLGTALDFR